MPHNFRSDGLVGDPLRWVVLFNVLIHATVLQYGISSLCNCDRNFRCEVQVLFKISCLFSLVLAHAQDCLLFRF